MILNNTLKENIQNDFETIKEELKFEMLNEELQGYSREIHSKLISLRIFINRLEETVKPSTTRYLNEVASDLIEAYVLLFQNRYKTSKMLLRSGIDCLIRGLYIEKVSIQFEDGFTETFRKLNVNIKLIHEAKGMTNVGYLDRIYTDLKNMFDTTSDYVHGGQGIELSQYDTINVIINPVEKLDLKIIHATEMNKYIQDMLYYLTLCNFDCLYGKCRINEQNVILENLSSQLRGVITGKLKTQFFG